MTTINQWQERRFSARVRYSQKRHEFLTSLRDDLRLVSCELRLRRKNNILQINVRLARPTQASSCALLQLKKRAEVQHNTRFIQQFFAGDVSRDFADGSAVIGSIIPSVQVCRTRKDFELLRMCSLLQSVSTPESVFRRLAFLVRDEGQVNKPLIGAFALSSPGYSIKCRDEFLGWRGPRGNELRAALVNRCMQLSLCMAVPPYSFVRAARLVAASVFSDTVANEFSERYGEDLLAVTTTAAKGVHAPMFTRIMMKPGGLYRRIGETAGYSVMPFSAATMERAKALVRSTDGLCPAITNHPIRLMKRSLDLCRLRREPFLQLSFPKGVYFGTADESAVLVLRGIKASAELKTFSIDEIRGHWQKDLVKASKREDLACKFKGFEVSEIPHLLGVR